MPKPELNTPERQEAEEHAAYLLGQCVGIEDTAGRLRVKSGEAFQIGNDDRARWLRDLAGDLKSDANAKRKVHDDYRKANAL